MSLNTEVIYQLAGTIQTYASCLRDIQDVYDEKERYENMSRMCDAIEKNVASLKEELGKA